MKRYTLIPVLLFLISCGLINDCMATAADTIKPCITAVRVDHSPVLSGKLDDPLWATAKPVELGFEASPGENIPAKVKTLAMILYDQNFIYIGFRCYDTLPGIIRTNLSDRDKIFGDDFVLATIDTYNNHQRGFEFAVNPYGIQGDLLMMGIGNEDEAYDMVWQSAASINGEGWTAEMAIPLKSLSFSSEENQTWTICLLRNMPRNNQYYFTWTPLDRNNPNYISQGGYLKGLEGIKPGKSLEFLPYTMIQQSGARSDLSDPASGMDNGKIRARI